GWMEQAPCPDARTRWRTVRKRPPKTLHTEAATRSVVVLPQAAQRSHLAAPQPGIQEVAQRVTQHVERQHDDADRYAGKDRQIGRRLQISRTLAAQHRAPGGSRRRSSQPEKAQRGL